MYHVRMSQSLPPTRRRLIPAGADAKACIPAE